MKRMRDLLRAFVSALCAWLNSMRGQPLESGHRGERHDTVWDDGADSSVNDETGPEPGSSSEQSTGDKEEEKAETVGEQSQYPAGQSHSDVPRHPQGEENEASSLNAGEVGRRDCTNPVDGGASPPVAEQPLKQHPHGEGHHDREGTFATVELHKLGANNESRSCLQSRGDVASERQKEGQAADSSSSSPIAPHGEAAGGGDAEHLAAAAASDLGDETGAVGQEVDAASDEPSISPRAASPDSPGRSDRKVCGAGEVSEMASSEKRRDGGETGETEERPAADVNFEGAGDAEESSTNVGENEKDSPSVPPVRTPGRRKRAPRYRAPGGGPPPARPSPSRRSEPNADRDTAIRSRGATIEVRVLFQRGGYCSVALLPKRPPDLPEELLVEGGAGNVELLALEDDWYQDIVPDNLGEVLREGLVLTDPGTGQEWVLSGREIFVLASGATHRGFVSCPRLGLGRDHVVLCATRRLQEVEQALREAGCASWTRLAEDDGVPRGWTVIRGVSPAKAVPRRDDEDILNILRPLPDVEIALEGGIRLAYNSWLHGYPPLIRVYGDPEHTEVVLIDGQEAVRSENQGYTVAGWAELGEHQVWCSNTSTSYSIVASDTDWRFWPAYSFALGGNPARGFSFCGPLVRPVDRAGNPGSEPGDAQPIQVPPSNPVLIGARPGEVFMAARRRDLRGARCLCLPPFDPVWALPAQPLHCDKEVSRVLLIGNATGVQDLSGHRRGMRRGGDIERWFRLILDASRKGLAVQPRDASTDQLWQSYKTAARNLRRRLR